MGDSIPGPRGHLLSQRQALNPGATQGPQSSRFNVESSKCSRPECPWAVGGSRGGATCNAPPARGRAPPKPRGLSASPHGPGSGLAEAEPAHRPGPPAGLPGAPPAGRRDAEPESPRREPRGRGGARRPARLGAVPGGGPWGRPASSASSGAPSPLSLSVPGSRRRARRREGQRGSGGPPGTAGPTPGSPAGAPTPGRAAGLETGWRRAGEGLGAGHLLGPAGAAGEPGRTAEAREAQRAGLGWGAGGAGGGGAGGAGSARLFPAGGSCPLRAPRRWSPPPGFLSGPRPPR
ncbi:hypothetical protein VULLAG_LOCUS5254 [Vulpes lagopus]